MQIYGKRLISLDLHLFPNLAKVTVSFDKFNKTELLFQIQGVYKANTHVQ